MADMMAKNERLIKAINAFVSDKDKNGAFQAIYEETEHYVYVIINRNVQDDSVTQDLMQEVFITVYRKLDTLENIYTFQKWLGCITSNVVNMYFRRKKEISSLDEITEEGIYDEETFGQDTIMLPEDVITNNESRKYIWNIINTLPEKHRQALISFYFSELSIKEIAETMEIPENTVKTYLSRGKKKMKEDLLALEKNGIKLAVFSMPLAMFKLFEIDTKACILPETISSNILQACLNRTVADVGSVSTVQKTSEVTIKKSSESLASNMSETMAQTTSKAVAGASSTSVSGTASATTAGVSTAAATGAIHGSIGIKVLIGLVVAGVVGGGIGAAHVISKRADETKDVSESAVQESEEQNPISDAFDSTVSKPAPLSDDEVLETMVMAFSRAEDSSGAEYNEINHNEGLVWWELYYYSIIMASAHPDEEFYGTWTDEYIIVSRDTMEIYYSLTDLEDYQDFTVDPDASVGDRMIYDEDNNSYKVNCVGEIDEDKTFPYYADIEDVEADDSGNTTVSFDVYTSGKNEQYSYGSIYLVENDDKDALEIGCKYSLQMASVGINPNLDTKVDTGNNEPEDENQEINGIDFPNPIPNEEYDEELVKAIATAEGVAFYNYENGKGDTGWWAIYYFSIIMKGKHQNDDFYGTWTTNEHDVDILKISSETIDAYRSVICGADGKLEDSSDYESLQYDINYIENGDYYNIIAWEFTKDMTEFFYQAQIDSYYFDDEGMLNVDFEVNFTDEEGIPHQLCTGSLGLEGNNNEYALKNGLIYSNFTRPIVAPGGFYVESNGM